MLVRLKNGIDEAIQAEQIDDDESCYNTSTPTTCKHVVLLIQIF